MSFGYPAVLWGLLAVPLPLLVHLFFRRRKSEIAFSTLLFFKPHRREWAMRRRIREAVLLAFKDLETGETLEVESEDCREGYLDGFAAYRRHLKQIAGRMNMGFEALNTRTPFERALLAYFHKRERLG